MRRHPPYNSRNAFWKARQQRDSTRSSAFNERLFQQAATHQLLNCCCLATAPGLWLSCSPGIKTQEPVFYCLPAEMFLGDFDSRSASISLAAAGACTFPAQICSPVTFFPYRFSFAPSSGPSEVPDNETPPNTPFAREEESIYVLILPLV